MENDKSLKRTLNVVAFAHINFKNLIEKSRLEIVLKDVIVEIFSEQIYTKTKMKGFKTEMSFNLSLSIRIDCFT